MRRPGKDNKAQRRTIATAQLLSAVPHANRAAEVKPYGEGVLVKVPIQRPSWLVPPLSWILPFSKVRRIALDGVGAEVLRLCDGRRTVEEVIETFAQDHKLSFREAQIAVTQFLGDLLKRGIVAFAGS